MLSQGSQNHKVQSRKKTHFTDREADPFSKTKQITKVSLPRRDPGRLPTQGILHTVLSTLKVFPASPPLPKLRPNSTILRVLKGVLTLCCPEPSSAPGPPRL